jgi:hypothetical protein
MPLSPAPFPFAGEGSCCSATHFSASWRDEMVVIVPGLVILIFVSSQTGFSVHSRYIIPALPILFVWTSKVARVFEWPRRSLNAREQIAECREEEDITQRRKGAKASWFFAPWRLCVRFLSVRTMRVLVIIALVWSVASSLSIYPHSLSYFNELAAILPTPADASYPKPIDKDSESCSILSKIGDVITAGPRNGPRHLLDSNIDWGQDLFYLKDWLDAHPNVKLEGLLCESMYPASLVRIPETPMPMAGPSIDRQHLERPNTTAEGARATNQAADQPGPKPGWYALSVNFIYDRDRQYRYFLNFRPVAMAGYSIYIYHITLDEANRVRREMGLAELTDEDCKLQNENRKMQIGGGRRSDCHWPVGIGDSIGPLEIVPTNPLQ